MIARLFVEDSIIERCARPAVRAGMTIVVREYTQIHHTTGVLIAVSRHLASPRDQYLALCPDHWLSRQLDIPFALSPDPNSNHDCSPPVPHTQVYGAAQPSRVARPPCLISTAHTAQVANVKGQAYLFSNLPWPINSARNYLARHTGEFIRPGVPPYIVDRDGRKTLNAIGIILMVRPHKAIYRPPWKRYRKLVSVRLAQSRYYYHQVETYYRPPPPPFLAPAMSDQYMVST
ncbi:hypothetical protein RRG08_062366 [Elysia crispata]|uniref:Uncharacterized protein n=1 Tax=Elysia crispata TaxID=231223 RepID=A0AAE0YGH0_9GAST|nr:hypothetical protein RRG08_062366 [Elysia crispata]